ncbi:unnamed protein product [Clonostachys rosea f. rosea IK726]|uniref:Peroxisomal membrane protein PEX14 n=2 Tax=Bionectria ochroleuca TaxID=29856 RepID=A0A0B7JT81_BIOOC|nr:unnamed protein product [Clonostachys rosea f. rosea IK726]
MAIRDDLVASAVQFLQDPSVASSSVENRISFLRSKNLTQEEIDVALARTGGNAPPSPPSNAPPYPSSPPAQYYQPYPPNAWQPQPPAPLRRDWRDWFIMATVVGGVSYGIYSLGKRYVMPLVAPPTPEKLEQDKKSIEEQFERSFALVEQLAKDTEELKSAEKERTERLDKAIGDLESVMSDLKSANRRREDDAQRVRDEIQALKDAIPKALSNQKEMAEKRLREINGELTSLKTLVSQRMTANTTSSPSTTVNPLRTPATPTTPATTMPAATGNTLGSSSTSAGESAAAGSSSTPTTEAPKATPARTTGLTNGKPAGKASIPAWQMALSNQNDDASGSKDNQAASSS